MQSHIKTFIEQSNELNNKITTLIDQINALEGTNTPEALTQKTALITERDKLIIDVFNLMYNHLRGVNFNDLPAILQNIQSQVPNSQHINFIWNLCLNCLDTISILQKSGKQDSEPLLQFAKVCFPVTMLQVVTSPMNPVKGIWNEFNDKLEAFQTITGNFLNLSYYRSIRLSILYHLQIPYAKANFGAHPEENVSLLVDGIRKILSLSTSNEPDHYSYQAQASSLKLLLDTVAGFVHASLSFQGNPVLISSLNDVMYALFNKVKKIPGELFEIDIPRMFLTTATKNVALISHNSQQKNAPNDLGHMSQLVNWFGRQLIDAKDFSQTHHDQLEDAIGTFEFEYLKFCYQFFSKRFATTNDASEYAFMLRAILTHLNRIAEIDSDLVKTIQASLNTLHEKYAHQYLSDLQNGLKKFNDYVVAKDPRTPAWEQIIEVTK